jgi:hypothetical protein
MFTFKLSCDVCIVIPRCTSDECVRKNAKCHIQNRLPIIVWRNNLNKSKVEKYIQLEI